MEKESYKVLGIDQGSLYCGWSAIECHPTQLKFNILGHGVIKLKQRMSFEKRMPVLFDGLREVIEEYGPDEVVIEDVYVRSNIKVALTMGKTVGVCLLACRDIPLQQMVATKARTEVLGFWGRGYMAAQKQDVKDYFCNNYKLPKDISYDETDALCLAAACFYKKYK